MADFQPAPTWASPILVDKDSGSFAFNPVWLDWFLRLVQLIDSAGGGGGTFDHNSLGGLQGGNATERYHLDSANATVLSGDPGADRIIFFDDSAGILAYLTAGTGLLISGTTLSATGTGTVSSVALTVPGFLSVSGSPVTTSGTLAVSLATQTANTAFAGPTSGGAATPAFRALVLADIPSMITIGTEQATTSGTSIDFTGIPSGTKRITIMFKGVSTNGTDNLMIQIGDAGGIETSGYLGAAGNDSAASNFTAGAGILSGSAAATFHGAVWLDLEDASDFTWIITGNVARSDTNLMISLASSKSLSQELDRVRITTSGGTNTFDAGVINISYEK